MRNIKFIILDMDGTLLNHQKKITSKTKQTILAIQKRKIKIMLLSGRPYCGILPYAKELKMKTYHGIIASYNGRYIMDMKTDKVLFENVMKNQVIKKIIKHCKTFDVTIMVDDGCYLYAEKEDPMIVYEVRGNQYQSKIVENLSKAITNGTYRLMITGDAQYLLDHYAELQQPFSSTFECIFTSPYTIEYIPNNFNKSKMIQTVIHQMGYMAHEVMYIGDAISDIDMMQYSGIGIAMENAVDDVKECADFVTLSNDEDGIAYALHQLL